ncbi:hypothetical protein [Morganella psychrotolerans]|uniref:hypothetical protein n=1 Tax=Morganella psychrotolerans TaxID=368603 RepID=UPI0039B0BE41
MNKLTELKHPIDELLSYLSILSEYPIRMDNLIEIKNEHTNPDINISFTLGTHIERLETSRRLIHDINKDEYFIKYISYSNHESLLLSLKRLNKTLSSCNNKLRMTLNKIKKFNVDVIQAVIFNESNFVIRFHTNDIDNHISEYKTLDIFLENERVIDSLVNCLSDLLIIRDMKKNNEILYTIESNIPNIHFLDNLMDKKDEINKLTTSLLEEKEFIEKISSYEKNFDDIISSYKKSERELLNTTNTLNTSINKTNTELTDFKSKSDFINEKYILIKNDEASINSALESISEIKKAGVESNKINDFMSKNRNEIVNILADARSTLNLVSGASIARYITRQEEKENKAANFWLTITGIILLISLILIILSFKFLGFSWDAFILKSLTLPILLSALIFAMRQYIKRKNIVDSYAHKKTLALSLTGFRKQINSSTDDEKQINYILKAIEIMTESPLNDLDKNHIKNELEALEKIRESIIENVISTINPEKTNKKED